MIPFTIYLFILIELTFVAYGDFKTRKISNLWSILNIGSFITLILLFPKVYTVNFDTFLYSITFFIITFIFFLLRIMGGGDSKFLTTFFLIVPLSLQDKVFYNLLLSTIGIGLFFLIHNTINNHEKLIESLKNSDVQGIKSCFGTKFAYAPVILLAWIWLGWDLKDTF